MGVGGGVLVEIFVCKWFFSNVLCGCLVVGAFILTFGVIKLRLNCFYYCDCAFFDVC